MLRQLSSELSNSIILDAINRVAESTERDFSLLLAMIISQQADLELILSKKFKNPSKQSPSTSAPASGSIKARQASPDSDPTQDRAASALKQQPRDQLESEQFKVNKLDSSRIAGSDEAWRRLEEEEKEARRRQQDLGDDCCLLCNGTGSLKLIDNNNNRSSCDGGIKRSSGTVYSGTCNNIASKCSQDLIRLTLPGALKRRTRGATSEREAVAITAATTTTATTMPAERQNSVNSHSCGDGDYEWARDQASKLIYWLLSRKQPSAGEGKAAEVEGSNNYDNGLGYERAKWLQVTSSESERELDRDRENEIEKENENWNEKGTEIELGSGLTRGSRCTNKGASNNNGISEADNSRLENQHQSGTAQSFHPTIDYHDDQLFKTNAQRSSTGLNEGSGNGLASDVCYESGLILSSSIDDDKQQKRMQKHRRQRDNEEGFNQEYNSDDENNVNYFEHKSQKRIQQNSKGLSGFRDTSQGTEQEARRAFRTSNYVGTSTSIRSNLNGGNINNAGCAKDTSFVATQIRDLSVKPLDEPVNKISEGSSGGAGNLLLLCGNCRKPLVPSDEDGGASESSKNRYSNDVENDHHDVHPSNKENHHDHHKQRQFLRQAPDVAQKASFDLLQELRFERQKLEEQVDRLRDCQVRAASILTAPGSSSSSAHQQLPAPMMTPPKISTTASATVVAPLPTSSGKLLIKRHPPSHSANKTTSNTCGVGQNLLSSNIQRMKRMDTLKRRKLKKQELERDQRGEICTNNRSSDLIDELKRSQCFQLISARQLDENGENSGKSLVDSEGHHNQAHHSAGLLELEEEEEQNGIGEEREEEEGGEEEEEGEDQDDDDDNEDRRENSTTCAVPSKLLPRADNNLDQAKLVAINKIQSLQRQKLLASLNCSTLPEDIQSESGQLNLDKGTKKLAAGHISKIVDSESPVKACFGAGAEVAPSHGRKESQAPSGEIKNRRTSAYSYQSLRVSLNNFVHDLGTGQHQQQQEEMVESEAGKKRFSSNFLSNMLISLSPFSSPIKKKNASPQQQQQQTQVDQTGGLHHKRSSNDQAVADQEQGITTSRKHSSRSHSSNSRRSANNNQQAGGQQSGSRGSNCSCLKSSSSQSFDFSLHGTK